MIVIVAVGCAAEQPASPASDAAKPERKGTGEPQLKLQLAEPGISVPPLDAGRFQTNLPAGWKLLPRRSEYLLGAYEATPAGIPRLLVHVSDSPLDDVVDAASAMQLQDAVRSELGDTTLAFPVQEIEIGDHYWVQYVRPAKYQNDAARQLALETIQGGRRYKLELFVPKDDLLAQSSAAYRVAHDAQFLSSQAEKLTEPATNEETSPDERKPDAPQPVEES
ncbi:MAG: hypothetical protein ACIALR_06180 [Blastopirellula sp. JB062]